LEQSAVIVFLVFMSLVNISLGFVLAVYLGRANLRSTAFAGPGVESGPLVAEPPAAPAQDERRTESRDNAWPAEAMAEPAPAADPAAPVAAETAEMEPAVETDLLAGIEEFRNQLASMKSEAGLAPRTPAAAAT
jgi:hypothetical protein